MDKHALTHTHAHHLVSFEVSRTVGWLGHRVVSHLNHLSSAFPFLSLLHRESNPFSGVKSKLMSSIHLCLITVSNSDLLEPNQRRHSRMAGAIPFQQQLTHSVTQ